MRRLGCSVFHFSVKRDVKARLVPFRRQSYQTAWNRRKWPFSPTSAVLLSVPCFTFGLGVWQIYRRRWKVDLISQMQGRLSLAPLELPDDLAQLSSMEYRTVRVVGAFDHSREMIVAPRSKLKNEKQGGGIMSTGRGNGAHVLTPFRLLDRNLEIIVNRGWVPKKCQNPANRMEGQTTGPTEVTGVIRLSEKRPQFVSQNRPEASHWNYRDVEAMASVLGTSPVYLEATADCEVPGGPIGGQTNVNIRNEHLSYILTWFTLSGLTSYMWYLQYLKK